MGHAIQELRDCAANDVLNLAGNHVWGRVVLATGQAHLGYVSSIDLVLDVAGKGVHVRKSGDIRRGEEGSQRKGLGEKNFDGCGGVLCLG